MILDHNFPGLTIDLETNCKAPPPFDKMSPHWPENKIVLCAHVRTGNASSTYIETRGFSPIKLLIGHNIKFDLVHLLKDSSFTIDNIPFLEYVAKNNVVIWDTQVAEYILSGQTCTYPSLDDLAEKYGGKKKDEKIKEYWAAGKDTSEIPISELREYAKKDVENTRLVALAQMEKAIELGMVNTILASCSATPALANIEYNGLHVDTDELNNQIVETVRKQKEQLTELSLIMNSKFPSHRDLWTNPDSPAQLKLILYGGIYKKEEKVPDGTFKNGKPKFKKVITNVPVPPIVHKLLHPSKLSTDEETLKEIEAEYGSISPVKKLLNHLLEYRKLKKIESTYLNNLTKLRYPDGCIHGSIDQVLTPTGRFNSSKPNLQNYPSGDEDIVKRCFSSRFGKDGVIVEADYKQLEVICLAHLSQDRQLIEDIKNGVDIHSEVGKKVFGHHMSPEERRTVKTVNFALIYGGGWRTIAKQSGVPEDLVKNIINAFYERYPQVRTWQTICRVEVERSAVPTGKVSKLGFPVKEGELISETGRRYKFFEKDAPDFMAKVGLHVSFSPTETKNYPVQGLATGDIVPMMVGVLWRTIYSSDLLRDTCLIVNTVHDSILFDIHKDVAREAIDLIEATLKDAPRYYEEKFKQKFDLPLDVEIKVGPNWKDLEKTLT
jgi:DNA polymerase I-like protein with 3'-5' exonuclease and polymerase domains